ncbi:zinc finger protein 488 [Rhinophrynus dorsalis]
MAAKALLPEAIGVFEMRYRDIGDRWGNFVGDLAEEFYWEITACIKEELRVQDEYWELIKQLHKEYAEVMVGFFPFKLRLDLQQLVWMAMMEDNTFGQQYSSRNWDIWDKRRAMFGSHFPPHLEGTLDRKNIVTSKQLKRITNFHSLAWDMEKERMEHAGEEICKSVLLEKTNCQEEAQSPARREEGLKIGMVSGYRGTVRRLLKAELAEQKYSAFTKVCRVRNVHIAGEGSNAISGSAFSPVPARYGCRISAFSNPGKASIGCALSLCNFRNYITGTTYCHASSPSSLLGLPSTEMLLKHGESSPPPQLLPPTLTPLEATAQNWCAKCRLSFHMTSDLVLHMRSRHKKEAGGETQRKRRRELQLSCPICLAYFKERHHLSRHMRSHC